MTDMRSPSAEEFRRLIDEGSAVYPEPRTVTLLNFQPSDDELEKEMCFCGRFDVAFDGQVVMTGIEHSKDITGRSTYTPPMQWSVGGAPYSCPSASLTPLTRKAITRALNTAIPRWLGAGKPRKPDSWPEYDSKYCAYLSEAELIAARERVVEGYEITVEVSPPK